MVGTLLDRPAPRVGVSTERVLTAAVVSTNHRSTPVVQQLLRRLGAHVTHIAHPAEAVDLFQQERVDLVLLLVGRGWESQIRRCRLIRESSDAPLVIVGEQGTSEQRIQYFEAGADDVLELDAAPAPEVEARLRSLVRLYRGESPVSALHGPSGLVLDIGGHTALVGQVEVSLTPGEYELLALLLERRGHAVPVSVIVAHVSAGGLDGRRNHIEALVSRLRVKLRAAGADGILKTVRQVGYRVS